MLIASDGTVLTAEEVLERMRTQHDARVAALEDQLRATGEARAEALRARSDLLQVCSLHSRPLYCHCIIILLALHL